VVLLTQDTPDSQGGNGNGNGNGNGIVVAFCSPPSLEIGSPWLMTDFSFGALLMADQASVIDDFTLTALAVQHVGDRALMGADGCAGVVVPLEVTPTSRVLGALVLVSQTPGLYHLDDALLAAPLTNMLALSLEHQRLSQEVKALAVVEERDRLAREVHDTLAQSLTNIIINLKSLQSYAARLIPTEVAMLAETEALAREGVEKAHHRVNQHANRAHEEGKPEAYPNLRAVLTRPINWELIRQQYNQVVKYAIALRLVTAQTEAILRRFTRNNLQHPTYQALAELGKAVKTIFLCRYLRLEALR